MSWILIIPDPDDKKTYQELEETQQNHVLVDISKLEHILQLNSALFLYQPKS